MNKPLSLAKKLFIPIISIIFIFVVWLSPYLKLDYNDQVIKTYSNKIDDIAIKYAIRDIHMHFQKLAFLSAYEHTIKLINQKNLTINFSIPILGTINGKSGASKAKHFLNEIKDIVNKYSHKDNLQTIYVLPFSANKYMYKIDVTTLQIYFIDIKHAEILNKNKNFIRIDLNKRFVYFNKEEILKGYRDELLSISKLNTDMNKIINGQIDYYNKNIIESSKWILTFIYLVFITLFLYSRKYIKIIYNYKQKKEEYNSNIHYSQHDVKTNSTAILNRLDVIYKNSNILENKKAKLNFLDCYAMELSIMNANDYAKKGSFNQYKVPSDLEDEKLFKWHLEPTEITKHITENIIDININIDEIEKYVIKVKNFEQLHKDELSSAIFRLLNNAIKHKKRSSKIFMNITTCENKRLKIIIINELVDDDIEAEVLEKINNSLDSNNEHNLPIVKEILSRYNLELKCTIENKQLTTVIKEKRK